MINGSYIGITIEQMDYLSSMKIRYEASLETRDLYKESLSEAYSQIDTRDGYIDSQSDYIGKLIEANSKFQDYVKLKDIRLEEVLKEAKRKKRNTALTFGAGGTLLGLAIAVLIAN